MTFTDISRLNKSNSARRLILRLNPIAIIENIAKGLQRPFVPTSLYKDRIDSALEQLARVPEIFLSIGGRGRQPRKGFV
jgi:hypothetical protein